MRTLPFRYVYSLLRYYLPNGTMFNAKEDSYSIAYKFLLVVNYVKYILVLYSMFVLNGQKHNNYVDTVMQKY